MFPLLTDQPMTPAQIEAVTRLLLHIAHVDGARTAEEVVLIREFYDSCRSDGAGFADFDTLAAHGDAANAIDFPDTVQREMLLALCLMVAYADGEFSSSERAAIEAAASRLQVSGEQLKAIEAQVKDYILARLAHLPDAASVAAVARELG